MFVNSFLSEMLLPFLLVFVVVFAALQKSKVLGEKKAQLDSWVALVIALLLIGIPQPRNIIVGIMPWLAVGVAVILVFLILYGFVAGDLSKASDDMKRNFGILAAIFTVAVVVYVSGFGSWFINWFSGDTSHIWSNVIMVVLVLGIMAFAVLSGKKKKD